MSKRKNVTLIAIIICVLLGILYVVVSILPYNKDSKWSALYFDADLVEIYGQS